MNDILMTNIFFLITAVSSIVVTILLSVCLYFVIKLVKKINSITQVVGDETIKIVADVEEARHVVKEHAKIIKGAATAAVIKKAVDKIFTK